MYRVGLISKVHTGSKSFVFFPLVFSKAGKNFSPLEFYSAAGKELNSYGGDN